MKHMDGRPDRRSLLTGGDYDANIQRRGREHKQFIDAGLPIPNARGGGSDTGAQSNTDTGGDANEEKPE